jgi:hypothetical protein
VTDGDAELIYRQPNAGSFGAGWLGDGLYTTATPTGWEFLDLDTGKVQRCLNAPDDGFVGKCPVAWQWLQSAIVAAQYHENETGKGWLQIGRSAPDLEKVQTRCIPADPAVAKADLHAARISPDGRWLLLLPPPGFSPWTMARDISCKSLPPAAWTDRSSRPTAACSSRT